MEKKAGKKVLNDYVENFVGNVENMFRNPPVEKIQKNCVFHANVENLKTC